MSLTVYDSVGIVVSLSEYQVDLRLRSLLLVYLCTEDQY